MKMIVTQKMIVNLKREKEKNDFPMEKLADATSTKQSEWTSPVLGQIKVMFHMVDHLQYTKY